MHVDCVLFNSNGNWWIGSKLENIHKRSEFERIVSLLTQGHSILLIAEEVVMVAQPTRLDQQLRVSKNSMKAKKTQSFSFILLK